MTSKFIPSGHKPVGRQRSTNTGGMCLEPFPPVNDPVRIRMFNLDTSPNKYRATTRCKTASKITPKSGRFSARISRNRQTWRHTLGVHGHKLVSLYSQPVPDSAGIAPQKGAHTPPSVRLQGIAARSNCKVSLQGGWSA